MSENVQYLRRSDRKREADDDKVAVPKGDMPSPPDFVKGTALQEWRRIAPELYLAGRFTILDVQPFAAYCMAFMRYREAELELQALQDKSKTGAAPDLKHGTLHKTKTGHMVNHPLVAIINVARRDMIDAGKQFGLTPQSRAAINANSKDDPDPISSKYF